MQHVKNPIISIIIPHKGREELLLATIESLKAQTLSPHQWEVIVVSQNAETSNELKGMADEINLSVVFNDEKNTISHSRNLGVKYANGEFLAFLDADVYLSPDWLETMLETIKNEAVVLASAVQVTSKNATFLEKIRTALSNADTDTFVSFLPGRNLFLSKNTFSKVEGFPEHLVTCEDYFFTDKVNQLGGLFYTSKANYIHLGEDKHLGPMFSKEIWRGQSNVASLNGRKIPLREVPSFVVPIAITFSLLASLLFLSLGQIHFAGFAACIGLFPALAYVFRLKKLVGSDVSIWQCVLFYFVYFPARAFGTIFGITQPFKTSTHK